MVSDEVGAALGMTYGTSHVGLACRVDGGDVMLNPVELATLAVE